MTCLSNALVERVHDAIASTPIYYTVHQLLRLSGATVWEVIHDLDPTGSPADETMRIVFETEDRDRARAEVARLQALAEALQLAVKIADETHRLWDRDNDSHVVKLLIALAGHVPGYRPETDRVHAVLKEATDG